MFSDKTIFNFVSNNTLQLSSKINLPGITSNEILQLSRDTSLYALRSNVTLLNLKLRGDVDNNNLKTSYFMKPINIQNKSINMTNIDIQLTGYIMRSIDPLSLYVSNIFIDFYAMMGGFHLNIACNYPEAFLHGEIKTNNITIINSKERTAPYRIPFFVTSGPEYVYMNNSNVYVSGSLLEDRAPIETHSKQECQPDDGERQYMIFDHIIMTLPVNPNNIRFDSYYIDLAAYNTRTLVLMYINSDYFDQNHMAYPTHQIFGSLFLEVHIINCTFTNVIWTSGGNMVTLAKLVSS